MSTIKYTEKMLNQNLVPGEVAMTIMTSRTLRMKLQSFDFEQMDEDASSDRMMDGILTAVPASSSSSAVVSPTTPTLWAPGSRRRTKAICHRAAAGQTAPSAGLARHSRATCR